MWYMDTPTQKCGFISWREKTFVTREIHHLRSFDIDSFFHASLSFSLFCCLLLFDAVPNRLLNKDFNELPNMGMTRKKLSQKGRETFPNE